MNKLYKRVRRAYDVKNDSRLRWDVNRSEEERWELETLCINTCAAIDRDVFAYCVKNHIKMSTFYHSNPLGQELERISRDLRGMANAFRRG